MNQKLAIHPIGQLLREFALPSIVAMLVGSLYNIVDQYFIGHSVGPLGNAATNISLPLSILMVALSLLFGIGGASAFNISMGQRKPEVAKRYFGNAILMLFLSGLIICILTLVFIDPLLTLFGSPANVRPYAAVYTQIIAFGFPVLVLTTGGGHLIRADGRPKMSMVVNMVGAILNVFLDAFFVFGLNMGMAGAALATIIGQYVSAVLVIYFFSHAQTVQLQWQDLKAHGASIKRLIALGFAPFSNQIALMLVQIVMNQTLTYYGQLSSYGSAIPLAVVGIIMKVNLLYMSFIIGLSQGLQPIASFNYGAENYHRVKEGYKLTIRYGAIIAVVAFLAFQLFPRQIIGLFGSGSSSYFEFAEHYFHIFLFFTFLNFLQPITSNFFTATGQPHKGTFLSLTRQVLFLLPLLILLPMMMGIKGVMYAGPLADGVAALVAYVMIRKEFSQKLYQ